MKDLLTTSYHIRNDVFCLLIGRDCLTDEGENLRTQIYTSIKGSDYQGTVIDLSRLKLIDESETNVLRKLIKITHLLTNEVYVVGMQPSLVVSIIDTTWNFSPAQICRDEETAIQCLMSSDDEIEEICEEEDEELEVSEVYGT